MYDSPSASNTPLDPHLIILIDGFMLFIAALLIVLAVFAIRIAYFHYRAGVHYLKGNTKQVVAALKKILQTYERFHKLLPKNPDGVQDMTRTYALAITLAHKAQLIDDEVSLAQNALNYVPADDAFFHQALVYGYLSQSKWEKAKETLRNYAQRASTLTFSAGDEKFISEAEQSIKTQNISSGIEAILYGESTDVLLRSFYKKAKFLRIYAPTATVIATIILVTSVVLSFLFPSTT